MLRSMRVRQAVANAIALIAVLGIVFGAVTGCGSPEQTEAPAPVSPGQSAAAVGAQDGADGPMHAAGQGAAALAALGGLGQTQGAAQNVRDLGTQVATAGQALLDQLRADGTRAAEPAAEQQAVLTDLRARAGDQFDQAWLRAAGQMQQQVRDAASGVLADPDASEEAKAAATEALARLDALAGGLRQATGPAGAETPRAVDAGSGGQAAGDVTPIAAVLAGIGAVLLAGALWWRRRIA